VDIKDGLNAILPVARGLFGLDPDSLERLGPADLTILFTDIQDYTGTTDRLGDKAAQSMVRAHNRIVRTALAEHGGREIKQTGDGIMAWFLSARRGVEAATAIQREIEAHNRRRRTVALRVRIGLNAGEPILDEGDLYGTPVIVAARVADLAAGGQIFVTDVVRQLAGSRHFDFRAVGDHRLDGLSEPVGIFEVTWMQAAPATADPAWSL
jgi:class 3 adenylate cyclase